MFKVIVENYRSFI